MPGLLIKALATVEAPDNAFEPIHNKLPSSEVTLNVYTPVLGARKYPNQYALCKEDVEPEKLILDTPEVERVN